MIYRTFVTGAKYSLIPSFPYSLLSLFRVFPHSLLSLDSVSTYPHDLPYLESLEKRCYRLVRMLPSIGTGTTQLPLLGRTNLDLLATKAPAIKHRIPTFVLTARTSKLRSVLNLGALTFSQLPHAHIIFTKRGWRVQNTKCIPISRYSELLPSLLSPSSNGVSMTRFLEFRCWTPNAQVLRGCNTWNNISTDYINIRNTSKNIPCMHRC
jgi:hypothetical protein